MTNEIELENGLRVEINVKYNYSSVIESKKVTGDVFVPRYVTFNGSQIRITEIKSFAFSSVKLNSLTFPEDSEVESFSYDLFFSSSITRLQIPPKLKKIERLCFCNVYDLVDIEVSPKNKNFSYIKNKYLVGKSSDSSGIFDVLHYARFDIEDAIIPSQIKIIDSSFGHHKQLKSVIFPKDSKLKRIESSEFSYSSISKIVLPATLEYIGDAFYSTKQLFEIEISEKNDRFKMIDKTILVGKIDPSSDAFESLILCRRNIESIRIPSYIKEIRNSAFDGCVKMSSVTFGPNSSLETIESCGFGSCESLKRIVLPPKTVNIEYRAFINCSSLESIEFLGQQMKLGEDCFADCSNLKSISFPNATKLEFDIDIMKGIGNEAVFYIRRGAEQVGEVFSSIQDRIKIIEPSPRRKQIITYKEPAKNEQAFPDKESDVSKYMRRIRQLEHRLSRYEEVKPFDPNSPSSGDDYENDAEYESFEEESKESKKDDIFIDEEDEQHHRVVCQIGEGATSITYKVVDERTNEEMCKKVLKAVEGKTTFKDLQNIYKEFEVLKSISHPCICKCIGLNPQEKVENNNNNKKADENEEDEDDDEEDEIKVKNHRKTMKINSSEKTTIAIFLKFHPMNLRECLESDSLNNTLKAKIAVEVAFGMSHIHEKGMIHRDLKLENVMVNYIFEAQLIDFGLAHVDEMKNTMTSKTKFVGTLAYMSPEMQNEEDYDNKTDVYSFGVLLFVLLTRRFPKQSMREKLNNIEPRFPKPSDCISSFSIELIKKCMSFDPSKRPSFDQILDEMFRNAFKIASEVDSEIVTCRYRYLNRYRAYKRRMQLNTVKSPSKNIGNRRLIKKPIIKKPI